jgi:hypothetical protein
MGLDDRDYMRKRRNYDTVEGRRDSRRLARDDQAGHAILAFFQKRPRFFPYLGVVTAILFVIALALSKK